MAKDWVKNNFPESAILWDGLVVPTGKEISQLRENQTVQLL